MVSPSALLRPWAPGPARTTFDGTTSIYVAPRCDRGRYSCDPSPPKTRPTSPPVPGREPAHGNLQTEASPSHRGRHRGDRARVSPAGLRPGREEEAQDPAVEPLRSRLRQVVQRRTGHPG